MTFQESTIPQSITTGYEDPVGELFIPLLSSATEYDVAVGYFTSGWIRDTAEGIASFALRGGISRWIISPELDPQDAACIMEGSAQYIDTIPPERYKLAEQSIVDAVSNLKTNTREELCALIACGILEFKIAIPKNNQGMMHAKIGIAQDTMGDRVAFSGSYNHTAAAKTNWENIEIYKSWLQGEETRVKHLKERFDSLWDGHDPTFYTTSPSINLLSEIEKFAGNQRTKFKRDHPKKEIVLRPYQQQAIDNWADNKGRGIFVMATGSGKTITALSALQRLADHVVHTHNKSLFVVIVVPLKHLLEQWYEEALQFGLTPVKCFESSLIWRTKLKDQANYLNSSSSGLSVAIVTNRTLSQNNFQEIIKTYQGTFLFVADEAHNLGSETYRQSLPENATHRLGLTATPNRFNDRKGTQALFEYFGNTAMEFTIEDAIEEGFLCPYYYHPHLCVMTDDEYHEYLSLAAQLANEEVLLPNGEYNPIYLRITGKKADLLSGVNSKLEILKDQLLDQEKNSGVSHTLVYCGSKRGEDNSRHIERTVQVIGNLGIKTRKFTASESMDDRRKILKMFETKDLQCLAAIKCLDEGVDIPATRVAYILASTANPKEFIQRRGRVLRKFPDKTNATIHDFLVIPPPGETLQDDLLQKELDRAKEFASIAINKNDCEDVISDLEQHSNTI